LIMPENSNTAAPVILVFGSDDFLVKSRSRQIFSQWRNQNTSIDEEIIDGAVDSQEETLKSISKLIQALNTLPFFGLMRIVWLKDCNFFSDKSRTTSERIWKNIDELARTIKQIKWSDVRLLISADEIDKRRSIFKVINEVGKTEYYEALSIQDPEWEDKAINYVNKILTQNGKKADENVLLELVNRVGPEFSFLHSEVEKLIIYTAERDHITMKDLDAVCSNNKLVSAFALADALGKRNLSATLKHLEEEFWGLQFDKDKSEIGILYGIISKVRTMLVAKSLAESKLVKQTQNYYAFKKQLDSTGISAISSLKIHPFVLHKAFEDSKNFTREELISAMELLLKCNHDLVSTQQDKKRLIQQALVKILLKTA